MSRYLLVLIFLFIQSVALAGSWGKSEYRIGPTGQYGALKECKATDVRIEPICELNNEFDRVVVAHGLLQKMEAEGDPNILFRNPQVSYLWNRLNFFLDSYEYAGISENLNLNPVLTHMLVMQTVSILVSVSDDNFKFSSAQWKIYEDTLGKFLSDFDALRVLDRANQFENNLRRSVLSLALLNRSFAQNDDFGVWPEFNCSILYGSSYTIQDAYLRDSQFIKSLRSLDQLCGKKKFNFSWGGPNFKFIRYQLVPQLEGKMR